MPFCRLKFGQPCIRYDAQKPAELDSFLTANGGVPARFDGDGKAHILNDKKGQQTYIYLLPGYYLRCIRYGQFGAVSSRQFAEEYEMVNHA